MHVLVGCVLLETSNINYTQLFWVDFESSRGPVSQPNVVFHLELNKKMVFNIFSFFQVIQVKNLGLETVNALLEKHLQMLLNVFKGSTL